MDHRRLRGTGSAGGTRADDAGGFQQSAHRPAWSARRAFMHAIHVRVGDHALVPRLRTAETVPPGEGPGARRDGRRRQLRDRGGRRERRDPHRPNEAFPSRPNPRATMHYTPPPLTGTVSRPPPAEEGPGTGEPSGIGHVT